MIVDTAGKPVLQAWARARAPGAGDDCGGSGGETGIMDLSLLRELFAHANWANRQVFAAARQLDDATLDQELDPPSTIRGLLTHLVDAHAYWLARARESSPPSHRSAAERCDVMTLLATWEQLDHHTQEFLADLAPADLARTIQYVNPAGEPQSYPLRQILAHQIMHAAQHRAELALALSRAGHSPGWLDFLVWVDLAGGIDESTQ